MAEDNKNQSNERRDDEAKSAFRLLLKKNGFGFPTWEGKGLCPADIYASLKEGDNEEQYYFEIKKTKIDKNKNVLFGAATLTEWEAADEYKGRYYFVLAVEKNKENINANNSVKKGEQQKAEFDFYIISPTNFMEYSIVPPFKIYFNIPFKQTENGLLFSIPGRNKDSIIMRLDQLKILKGFWSSLKKMALPKKRKRKESKNDFYRIDAKVNLKEQIQEYKNTREE